MRWKFLACLLLGLVCLSSFAAGNAAAAGYPDKPVHIVVGYPPGGATDIMARLFGGYLSQKLGQQFVIENKPGAGNNIGTEMVVRAAPDGYTLLLVNSANMINDSLYAHLNFKFVQDIAPVAGFVRIPNVMEVNPSVPAKTVAEFISYAKANPGKINMASSGNGTSIHLSGVLFMMMTGVQMTHVPYKGSAPALIDMMSGQCQVMFDNLPASIGHIKAGKLRPLAVTTATPSPELPGVPTVGDTVKGYEASAIFGLGAPKGTPKDVVEKLNAAVNEALKDPTIQKRLADLGALPMPTTVDEFGKVIVGEADKWAKVVHAANLSVK